MIVLPQVVVQVKCRSILDALIAEDGPLDGAKLGLYKAPFTPTKFTVLADLTVADFTGYALSAAITWGTPLNDPDGTAYVPGGQIEFIASGSAIANTIYGAYIVDAAGTGLIAVLPFDSSVGVSGTGQGVVVPLIFRYSGN